MSGGNTDDGRKQRPLHPLDIDAYWLQRRLSRVYSDAVVSQQRAGDVLSALRDSANDHDCENRLVSLLGYDCFDLIKLIKKHRQMGKILVTRIFCIKRLY